MAIALVASALKKSTNTTSATTDAINTTGASLLVVGVANYRTGAPFSNNAYSLTDSKGNTWAKLNTYFQGDTEVALFYCKNPTVGTNHTFTFSNTNGYPSIAASAYSGTDTSQNADQQNGAGASSASSLATGSVPPSTDNQLLVAFIGTTAASRDPGSIDAGFSLTDHAQANPGDGLGLGMAYKVQTTAAAVNPTFSITGGTAQLAAAIATFKAASGGGDTTDPTGSITNPDEGETYSGTINVTVSASDNVAVEEVEVFVDGDSIGTDSTSSYSVSLDTTDLTDDEHEVYAIIRDTATPPNEYQTPTISFFVDNSEEPPPPPQAKIFPLEISGFTARPFYSTDITEGKSGREVRDALWQEGKRKFDAKFAVKSLADARVLNKFFHTCKGRWKAFLLKDYTDYFYDFTATALTGNGVRTQFQMRAAYDDGFDVEYRKISRPKIGTVAVKVNGVLKTEDTDYTVNYETGIITFAVAPANAAVIEQKCEFYVKARFDTDELPGIEFFIFWIDLDDEERGLSSIETIPMIEIRE